MGSLPPARARPSMSAATMGSSGALRTDDRCPAHIPDATTRAPRPGAVVISSVPNSALSCATAFLETFFGVVTGGVVVCTSGDEDHQAGSCSDGVSYSAQSLGHSDGDGTNTSTGMT